ncbi:MAG: IS4 family transposase [Anaerolineae bacterium]|nr:IS4 family transposase [Anaerolineae bacterium]
MSECTTNGLDNANTQPMAEFLIEQWEHIAAVLPSDLATSARACEVLQRRRRIHEPLLLLRLVLLYALGLSLRLVGAWGVLQDWVDVSAVAILKRLRQCPTWLGVLLGQLLRAQGIHFPASAPVRLCLVDATTVQEPGRRGTGWRLHLSLDLGSGRITGVTVTDAHGGETLTRGVGHAGEIRIADRGYAFARSLGPSLAQGDWLVVRINWQNLPLQTVEGQRFDVIAWLQQVSAEAAPAVWETPVWLATPDGRWPARLIASALPQEAADRARQRARAAAKKKGRTVSKSTLYACGFVLLLTNLPADQWSASQVLALYRLRWQVEVLFHRWKGLLKLSDLRAHDPQLVQTCLLGKLILVVLCDALTQTVMTRMPDWFTALKRPVSPWRMLTLAYYQVRQAVLGPISWSRLLAHLPQLQRFLCDTPRRRLQQLAAARAWLARLSAVNVLTLS